jgi:plasmid stabilization system protein ParE
MPGMGKSVLFGKSEVKKAQQWRISGFESYLVFYRTEPSGITILRVLHGSRDINVELLES